MKINFHPSWDGVARNGSDIALIKLNANVEGSNFPVVASMRVQLREAELLTMIGWPKSVSSTQAQGLEYGQLEIVSNAECENSYGHEILESMMCAGGLQAVMCKGKGTVVVR